MATLTADDVKAEAARLGFVACGITDTSPIPHADALDRWLRVGHAGTMRYLHRQAKKRKDPRLADALATRVVVVLDSYHVPEAAGAPGADAHDAAPRVARYARGEDYHRVTGRRLEALAALLTAHGARTARPYVDTGPVQERELAQRAGLGWIGKNTMLIAPTLGSWTFIGVVLTDLPLAIDPPFDLDRCGSCRLCLDACPTDAFAEPRVLDATRCLSYLTIEQKPPIAPPLAARMEGWAFGCDICNAVCPWNVRFAAPTAIPAFAPRPPVGLAELEAMDEAGFAERFGDTALARVGLERLRRNARLAVASVTALLLLWAAPARAQELPNAGASLAGLRRVQLAPPGAEGDGRDSLATLWRELGDSLRRAGLALVAPSELDASGDAVLHLRASRQRVGAVSMSRVQVAAEQGVSLARTRGLARALTWHAEAEARDPTRGSAVPLLARRLVGRFLADWRAANQP
ncbi:MAG: tRNA epoxyqueuosine(34) reductase QueG [Gemmatimonadales bacterium]|nr:tRNA epoxyqueuosine(34) reductase QueG [Gemmatimonadales bacterium]